MKGMGIGKSLAIALSTLAAFVLCGLAFKGEILTRASGIAECVIEYVWGIEGETVLVVSSHVPDAEALAQAAAEAVTVVRYDARKTSPSTLVAMIREKTGGRPIRYLALAVESQGQNAFNLTAGVTVSLTSILVNEAQKDFFRGLGGMFSKDGHIDILACDCAAGEYGLMLIDALKELTGATVAASTNATGNPEQGGDWVLETDFRNVAECYFNPVCLRTYDYLLENPSIVKDINPGIAYGAPQYLTVMNGILYFSADNGTNGIELWKSDGTSVGTIMVKDINPGIIPGNPYYLTEVNGTLYFQADDGTNGTELWKTDGSSGGTVMVKDINSGSGNGQPWFLRSMNGMLYFQADNGTNGFELWKSDGTSLGTVMVKDIIPGIASGYPSSLAEINSTLYFRATDGTNGTELWKSDGTSGGTVMVRDINPGSGGSNSVNFTDVGGTLYFSATEGTNGNELWKSDGTSGGTVMVKDINPGIHGSNPEYLTEVSGTLYFKALVDANGYELWKSDGTSGGTVMVKDIRPGSAGSEPFPCAILNGILFFGANDGMNGVELWKSDGTAGGTAMVKDINPGSANGNPSIETVVNGVLYFGADDGTNGSELWKSDGTPGATVIVKDINPGSLPSSPSHLTHMNGIIYFMAYDGTNGYELWMYDIPVFDKLQVSIPDTILTANVAIAGDTILIPIYMDSLVYGLGNGIFSFQTKILFSDSLYEFTGHDSSGTVLGNWGGLSEFTVQSRKNISSTGSELDTIKVAAASDDSIYYPEVTGTEFQFPRPLIKLKFRVNPGIASADSTPLNFVYFQFNEGIPTAVTDNGSMKIYLNMYGDVDQNGIIQPYDAVLVLRYVIDDTTLSNESQQAAEVSGSGTISAYDASLILQYYVGKITTFPVGDYFKRALPSNRGAELALEWGELKDGMLTLLVNAKNLTEVYGYSMELAYDPSSLEYVGANLTEWTSGMINVVRSDGGIIRFAAAGSEPIEGDGALMRLTFRVTGEIGAEDIIQLTEMILNEELVISNASSVAVPKTYAIEQNYPNPFNPTTHIRYQIPEAAQVQITIYNLLGQRIRTLVDEAQSAGAYDILWDGTNDNGVKLASGVYIYRMKAGSFTQIQKSVMMK